MIRIQSIPVGALQVNCYIVKDVDTGLIAVIDPGAKTTALENLINTQKNNIKYILLTHGHFDHIGYAKELKDKTNAQLVISNADQPLLSDDNLNLSLPFMGATMPKAEADITAVDNDTIMLGNSKITFILTPGHTKGSGCYIIDDCIFTGDTLMRLSMGRTDFPTSSDKEMMSSLARIAQITGEYKIYPGHGEFSTLSYEKNCNPYMKSVI